LLLQVHPCNVGATGKLIASETQDASAKQSWRSRTAISDFISSTIDLEMSQPLSEDDIYRTSTQYRLWSFSPEALATLRKQTHDLAIERARQYAGERVVQNGDSAINGVGQQNGDVDMERIECLTEEEELRLVQRYCDQIRTTSDHFKWPVNVKVRAFEQDPDNI
jgi:hypothetical protein